MIITSLLIEVTGDLDLISPKGLTTFASGVVNAANDLFSDETRGCDPLKRVIVAASAELVSGDALSQTVEGRRALATVRRFSIKVTVSYQCNNCKTGAALLKNDAVRRRWLEPEFQLAPPRRHLNTFSTDADPCTCPEGSSEFMEPTRSEFDLEFNTTVTDLIANTTTGELAFVTRVGKTIEVVEFNCSVTAPVGNRTTYMTLRACVAGTDQVDIATQQFSIEDAIKVSLNELLATYCNRESRNITAVSFLGSIPGLDCEFSKFFFSVKFNCRGCPLDMKLLSNITGRRALVADWIPAWGDGTHRRLLGGSDACFCDVGLVDNREPSESEVRSIGISICHLNECLFCPDNIELLTSYCHPIVIAAASENGG